MIYQGAARSHGIELIAARWHDFRRWWLTGLRETIPQTWLTWIHGENIPQLVIRLDGDVVIGSLITIDATRELRTSQRDFELSHLEDWLKEFRLDIDQVSVGAVVNPELFFVRNLTLPAAAVTALPRILEQDLLRRTPFQLVDIWHGATEASRDPGDVLTMRHWIVRKDRAETALKVMGLRTDDVDFLAVNDPTGNYIPVIRYRETMHEDPTWAKRAIKLLSVTALSAMLLTLAAFECIQQSIATETETSLAAAQELVRANGGRGDFDKRALLFAMKSDASVLAIWEELSKILPDHTFLTESQISGGRITITGFSADAARLIRLIDQSVLFTGAILSTGITPNAAEQKDHFTITFRTRNALTLPSFDQSMNNQAEPR
jgi:general secretion pathway protein L